MKRYLPLPEWFSTALENTRKNYRRINVSKQVCPSCGCPIHVATDWIGLPKHTRYGALRYFRAAVYPFCACAQAMESERLKDMVDQSDEWWANAVKRYHEDIASPESDEHRENMLRGFPTRKLLGYIIDPNQ
jgi:hypothetical protein